MVTPYSNNFIDLSKDICYNLKVIVLKGGGRMLKEILSAALAVIQVALSCPADYIKPEVPDNSYIIHGAGIYGGLKTTNSYEALQNAYNAGNRYIELDFNFTSDLKPVCLHDWNHLSFSGYNGVTPTLEEFMEGSIYSTFTPMSLDTVAEFMNKHKDLYIITDVKDYNIYFAGLIKKNYPHLLDRFIIQVYSAGHYEDISNLGFPNIIFSLYKLDWETKTNAGYFVSFSKKHKVYGYTFPAELCQIEGFVDGMLGTNASLFVHTVNDNEEQQKYFDMGITGIYTDNTIHK